MMYYIKKIIKPIFNFFVFYFTNYIIEFIPFRFIRTIWLKNILQLKKGKKTYLDMGIYFLAPWRIKIGNNSHINRGCFLDARGTIKIGNSVSISHNVSLITGSHMINSNDFQYTANSIEIDDFCFIGANATLLGGIKIGKGAIICAGAIVTKDIAPFSIVAGVPAKVIGKREEKEYKYICNPNSFFI